MVLRTVLEHGGADDRFESTARRRCVSRHGRPQWLHPSGAWQGLGLTYLYLFIFIYVHVHICIYLKFKIYIYI